MTRITITNRGQAIESTNYWDSQQAAAGFFFLSTNAGAMRLLVPDSHARQVREMRGAHFVIVSRGPWVDQGGRDAIELLFEDGSDSPYCIHMLADQCDRIAPDAEQGGGFVVTVWTRAGEQLRMPGKYRVVNALPCLDPWVEQ